LEKIVQPKLKVGLLVGAVGLALNVCVAAASGLCGPGVSLIGGALAGFFAARQENPASKADGARAGAISGAIAGALILIGQIIGGISLLMIVQFAGINPPFGQVPSTSADVSQQMLYYVSGLGTGICFGLVGTVLATLAGAGTGYLGTPDQPQVTQNS
jgi:hypothetical protein